MATVEAIYVCKTAGEAMQSIERARAVPTKGLEGDRYYSGEGKFSPEEQDPDYEVTLIEAEAVEAFQSEYQSSLTVGETRRNIVTRGILLNDLAGKEFKVGEVTIRGIRLCEPCEYLKNLTGEPVLPGLVSRGGLRAQILTEGWINVGDAVEEIATSEIS